MSKSLGQLIAEAGGAHLRNRQTAAGDDQRRRIDRTPAGLQREAVAGSLYSAYHAIHFDADTGLPAFIHQHLHDYLRGQVAKQLSEFFLVVGDAMAFHHRDEIQWAIAGQR